MIEATGFSGFIRINFRITPCRVSILMSLVDRASAGFLEEGVVAQPIKNRETKMMLVKTKMPILQFIDLIIPSSFFDCIWPPGLKIDECVKSHITSE
jgi:hypothetical protein